MTRRLLRISSPLLAVAGLLVTGSDAAAGWDNVFQVCCHDCKPRPIRSFFRAQGCDPCPPDPCPPRTAARVEYQRSYYYEPVTVMKPERYTVEVPTTVRSHYWEPVTSYTRASYYDPCTCTCQEICVPRTSYVRREKCDTVMRYVERCRMVPVQVQRKVEVTRPVITYYGPETRRYLPADCELPPAGLAVPAPAGPRVDEFRTNPPTVMPESGTIPPQQLPITEGSRRRMLSPTRPATGPINAHTTSRPGPASLRGEIVQSDQVTPRPGAKLVFVSATDHDRREYVTADRFGNFDLRLPAGDWHVYLGNGNGRAVYHKKITVGAYEAREFMVVSR